MGKRMSGIEEIEQGYSTHRKKGKHGCMKGSSQLRTENCVDNQ